ncbi:MAG: EAL domain-containing protein [Gemmatimonadetes bacterium]|nr:EAL domain-containing protein [Gemmatimonadota bacterium]
MHALAERGVILAIDDFGTGYSSLAYLQRFPVHVLKIDKAFIDGVAHGGTSTALARTIIALGDTLGLRTIAEGVEHDRQRVGLLGLGCTSGQGYLFARPLDASALETMLTGGQGAMVNAG